MANFKSVDYIITAKHYGGSARGYIRKMQQDVHKRRGVAVTIKNLDQEPTGTPVIARIWQGQWIADCECNGASFVDPDEPVFFCFSCGNRANGQKPRPVSFPPKAERLEIERLLLERPVDDLAGLTDMERAGMAKALLNKQIIQPDGSVITLPLTRSWEAHESIEDLRAQQAEPIRKWHIELKTGGHGVQ
jgi:hypothetical protein